MKTGIFKRGLSAFMAILLCFSMVVNIGTTTAYAVSAPMIKCKKTPRKKCRFMAERRKKR